MKSITVAAVAAYMSAFTDASVILPLNVPAIIPRADASPTGQGVEQPSSKPIAMQPVVQGCFKDLGELVLASTEDFNSMGNCGQGICQAMGKNVAASMEKKCYCGDKYPAKTSLTEDKNCNIPCPGFSPDACGGLGSGGVRFYTVYNTGLELHNVQSSGDPPTTTTSSNPTAATTATSAETSLATQGSQSDAANKPSGTNTAGIAAGAVVGVVALVTGIGGVFLYLRRKSNRTPANHSEKTTAI